VTTIPAPCCRAVLFGTDQSSAAIRFARCHKALNDDLRSFLPQELFWTFQGALSDLARRYRWIATVAGRAPAVDIPRRGGCGAVGEQKFSSISLSS
jgi:hypothetical protein